MYVFLQLKRPSSLGTFKNYFISLVKFITQYSFKIIFYRANLKKIVCEKILITLNDNKNIFAKQKKHQDIHGDI